MFNGQSILVTGGTGSLGKATVKLFLEQHIGIDKVRVFSRDELKHQQMKLEFEQYEDRLEYMIGDVRDYDRLEEAIDGMDIVVHAAAMKQVGSCESNPHECFKTNVIGTQNLIKAANHSSVSKVLFISSDKAVEPVSVYGNSKQAGEKLIISASTENIKFGAVRLGNLLGSSGSVVPLFTRLRSKGRIPITDFEITRFCGTIHEGAESIKYALENMIGGEVFIPKWNSFRIVDLAKLIAPNCELELIGLQNHEKVHEKLIGTKESENTFENSNYWIFPKNGLSIDQALDYYQALAVQSKVMIDSRHFILSIEELRLLINPITTAV
ncbi:MAG: polysaccharide biosynthesis protein [bacterium]|nr:polysaccharide biosynthesis protein [bacterium]